MRVEAVMVSATTDTELKRLLKNGGEIWQQIGKREQGKMRMQETIVRLPYDAALTLGLITTGPKLKAPKEPAA
jgi:hypothetical protein